MFSCVSLLQVDLNDVESSTILAFRHITDMGEGALRGPAKRQALSDWLALLAAAHPLDRRARAGPKPCNLQKLSDPNKTLTNKATDSKPRNARKLTVNETLKKLTTKASGNYELSGGLVQPWTACHLHVRMLWPEREFCVHRLQEGMASPSFLLNS